MMLLLSWYHLFLPSKFLKFFALLSKGRVPEPYIFLWIAASAANVDVFSPNDIETPLVNDLSTFFIKDSPVFSNGFKSLTKNPPILWLPHFLVLENLMLAEEPFAKGLQSFVTCVLVNVSS